MSTTGSVELADATTVLPYSEEIDLAEGWEPAHEPLTANGGHTLTDPDLGVLAKRLYGLTHQWRVQVEPRRDPERDPYVPLTAQAANQSIGSSNEHRRFGKSQTYMRRIRGIGRVPYHPLTHHDPDLGVQLCYMPEAERPSADPKLDDGAAAAQVAEHQYQVMTAHSLPIQPEFSARPMEKIITFLRSPFLPMTLLYGGFPSTPEGAELPSEWAQARAQWSAGVAQLGIVDIEAPQPRRQQSNYWMLRCGKSQRDSDSLLWEIVQSIVPDDNAAAANVVPFPIPEPTVTTPAAVRNPAHARYALAGQGR